MKIMTRVLVIPLALAVFLVAHLPAQEPPLHNPADDLRGRHPNLFKLQAFSAWLKERQVGPWHESPVPQGGRMVVGQDGPGDAILAAQRIAKTDEVQRYEQFNLRELKQSRAEVNEAAARANLPRPGSSGFGRTCLL